MNGYRQVAPPAACTKENYSQSVTLIKINYTRPRKALKE